VAQPTSTGVSNDVVVRFVDWLIRAVVVAVLFLAYLGWLGRSPVPALAFGVVTAAAVRAWWRAPWVMTDRQEATAALRATRPGGVDLMTSRELQQLIARLLCRDSFVEVRATGLRDDLSTDVVGRTPAGHRIVVVCNRDAPRRRVKAPDVQRFLSAVREGHSADIAVLVTTGRFTRSALALGERRDVVLLDRFALAAWMTGRATRLTPYLPAAA
jgi:restriction system protein